MARTNFPRMTRTKLVLKPARNGIKLNITVSVVTGFPCQYKSEKIFKPMVE
jgi:hypothetical protein